MSNMEQIIRPFLPRDVRPTKVPVPNTRDSGPVTVTIGARGRATVFKYSKFETVNFSSEIEYVEVSRDTTTKRIENPNDPNQFVEVESIRKIIFRDKNDPKAKHYPYNLNEFGGTP